MMYTLDEVIQLYEAEAESQKNAEVAEIDRQIAIWLSERNEYKSQCEDYTKIKAELKNAIDTNRDNIETITRLNDKLNHEKRVVDMQRGELVFATQIIRELIKTIGGENDEN